MNPELRKRFVNSIEYLRRMDFFKGYSDLTSDEILDKIFNGETDYDVDWFVETWPKKERGARGRYLRESLEEHEDYWMKASDFDVDKKLSFFDVKRVFVEDVEVVIEKDMCEILLRKLARISRGVFNPRYIGEEMLEWDEEPPPALKAALGKWCSYAGWIFKVFFEFRGKEHLMEFYSNRDYLYMDPAIKKINELIKDAGYQYYAISDLDYTVYAVFSEGEAEKLEKERGWKLYLP